MYSVLPGAPVKPLGTLGTRPDTEKCHAKPQRRKGKTKTGNSRKKAQEAQKKLNRKTKVVVAIDPEGFNRSTALQ
jgi:hypothetical protein